MLSDPGVAANFACDYACHELNVLLGWLEFEGRPDVAALWWYYHLAECADPGLH